MLATYIMLAHPSSPCKVRVQAVPAESNILDTLLPVEILPDVSAQKPLNRDAERWKRQYRVSPPDKTLDSPADFVYSEKIVSVGGTFAVTVLSLATVEYQTDQSLL
jgi:hypothetical protein